MHIVCERVRTENDDVCARACVYEREGAEYVCVRERERERERERVGGGGGRVRV